MRLWKRLKKFICFLIGHHKIKLIYYDETDGWYCEICDLYGV